MTSEKWGGGQLIKCLFGYVCLDASHTNLSQLSNPDPFYSDIFLMVYYYWICPGFRGDQIQVSKSLPLAGLLAKLSWGMIIPSSFLPFHPVSVIFSWGRLTSLDVIVGSTFPRSWDPSWLELSTRPSFSSWPSGSHGELYILSSLSSSEFLWSYFRTFSFKDYLI